MAAQPEEEAQNSGLKLPKLSVKNTPVREERRSKETSEFLCPTRGAQWKETFYEKVQQRALRLQQTKVEQFQACKAEGEKIKKNEPLDWLSKEWFNDETATRDTRAYLLDKLLPTLVPGVEKLLMEVERKKVLDTSTDPPKLDPIHFLGEYLMRHNPQFDVSARPGPYLRGMKMVMEELKTEVPDTALNRLARMKSEVKKKREQREQVERIKSQVTEMRKQALAVQFKEWTLDVSGRIPLALVQSALRSFLDVVSSASPGAGREIYDRKLETIDTLEANVNEEKFIEYVYSYIQNFTSDMFQGFLKHLCQCADELQDMIRHNTWRQMFTDLFLDCSHGKVGLLDRQRILALLEDFYESSPVLAKRGFQNPRQWPIIELQEIELAEFWGDFSGGQIVSAESRETFACPQTEVSKGETLPPEPLPSSGPATDKLMEESEWPEATPDETGNPEKVGTSESATSSIHTEEPGLTVELSKTIPTPAHEEVNTVSEENPAAEGQVSQKRSCATTETEETTLSPSPQMPNTLMREELGEVSQEDAKGGTTVSEPSSSDEDATFSHETASSEAAGIDQQPDAGSPGSSKNAFSEPASGASQEKLSVAEEPSKPVPGPDSEDQRIIWDGESGSEGQLSQKEYAVSLEPSGAVPVPVPTPEVENNVAEEGGEAGLSLAASKPDAEEEAAVLGKETPAGKEGDAEAQVTPSGSRQSRETGNAALPHEQDQREAPSHSPRQEAFEEASQEMDEIPWSGDLLTSNLSFGYSSYGDQIPEDWNNENSRFPDLRMIMAEIQTRGASRARSAFDQSCLNLPQFVQLMETFVGEDTSLPTVKRLVAFIKRGYIQTEEEKLEQLEKVHRESLLARRKLLMEALFEKWDNEGSGFLDLKEVDSVLCMFKEGMEKEALKKAKKHFHSSRRQPSGAARLSRKEFHTYLELVVSELTGNEDEVLENMVEFLTMSVERTHVERLRGSARRKWLLNIQHAAETSGTSMEPVYKAVFRALSQDAEAHGNNKKISAYIALLEKNRLSPERGNILLRYVACTAEDAPYVLNQVLHMDMKGISFVAVEEGKPIHVPRVQLHGNIHFWNCNRPEEERKGSFLVLPLQDSRWRVFGILGLDTLQDQCEQTIFLTHEISFYQGVSHAFSKAYHHIRTLENIMQVAVTALDWLHPRAPTICAVTTYLVEPGRDKMCDYTLRKMMTTDHSGQIEIHSPPTLFSRKENIFRGYLFKCADSSGVISACVYGECHIAVPLRESSGKTLGVFDLITGPHQGLPPPEHKDLQAMLKMVQAACSELLRESAGERGPSYVLEAEHVADVRCTGVLFHRLMLQDLRECVQKLSPKSFAEIKSYIEPPAVVHNILKAVLLLFYPQWKGSEKTENWSQCALKLDGDLIQKICCFDPTAASAQVWPELVSDCIKGVPRGDVWKHGSVPAECLYNWVLTCLALAELTQKLPCTKAPSLASLTPRPSLTADKSSEMMLSPSASDSLI
ncbi:PREDICTED: EF-hand calcium-binding domain-containing protein 5 [Gavialis gangeticus]|uniref:EF-hand calcium-binding domain-containing protein 5 n=1 Tax=Gavialis gangeticus TaxID=94835 RepID=UPI00092F4788|nr:PREDICTED: EF-hand calcium-binding domain-containing protein 5 [Gavialis gangeticus]XP_019366785.1 PREDICTED: EF-hand calcium-binding domain-containing protein 5 [Gavialis gangeticus]